MDVAECRYMHVIMVVIQSFFQATNDGAFPLENNNNLTCDYRYYNATLHHAS